MPRQLLLSAGRTATIIVAMIGPAAFWMIITSYINGGSEGPIGMAGWVALLFYSSWFLFAIAIGVATRSYQLRTEEQKYIKKLDK
jgi:fatty acid desaturase